MRRSSTAKQNDNSKGQTGTFEETAKFGEMLVLAAKGTTAEEVLKLAGIDNLSNKIIIDATNPISDTPPTKGVLHFFTTVEEALMERLQKLAPDAKFVKAFNSIGSPFMYKPQFPDGKPTMFICGNDDASKRTVTDISHCIWF